MAAPSNKTITISIVIPVLNDLAQLRKNLPFLLANDMERVELIIVDGGSDDGTASFIETLDIPNLRFVRAAKGRARQMNAGAKLASGTLLLFLHIDSRLPHGGLSTLRRQASTECWGRFDVRLDDGHPAFRVIEWFINHRSRLSSIATGDQGLFVSKHTFDLIGGFPDQALMEDVELCKTLKSWKKPLNLNLRIVTSARKWKKEGIVRTVLLMWSLRFHYMLGASPAKLAERYYS